MNTRLVLVRAEKVRVEEEGVDVLLPSDQWRWLACVNPREVATLFRSGELWIREVPGRPDRSLYPGDVFRVSEFLHAAGSRTGGVGAGSPSGPPP